MTKLITPVMRKRIALLVLSSFMLAVSGLYGIAAESFWRRWIYWACLIAIGIWLSDALSRQLRPWLAKWPWILHWFVFSTILSLPLFGMVALIQGLGNVPIYADAYASAAIKVWLVTAVITAFGIHRHQDVHTVDIENKVEPEASANTLLERAKKDELHSSTLLAIGAEDHYVRLITDQGEDLILMRFSDALRETNDIDGAQIHRSWWVAKHAIAKFDKKPEGGNIILHNGLTVPVSRRYLKDLKARGWL
jgi:hypothetical protein